MLRMGNQLPAVDAYIAKAPAFAQPILTQIRKLVHKTIPEAEEAIKWSMPFFLYRGIIIGNIAAFKEHCSFGLWNENVQGVVQDGVEKRGGGMGSFGKLTSLANLPSDAKLKPLLLEAARKIEAGERTKNWAGRTKKDKPAKPVEVPEALAAALKKNKAASKNFETMSPSCRREYAEWIAEAKREETREKRIVTAIEWISEGKQRNWKYQNC